MADFFDYFAAQVLRSATPELQEFLKRASLMPAMNAAMAQALADVEQALIRYQGSSRAMTTALARLAEADRLLQLKEVSYSQGQDALGDTLQARRLREAQLVSALEAKRSVLLGYVALHKALGGGFGGA